MDYSSGANYYATGIGTYNAATRTWSDQITDSSLILNFAPGGTTVQLDGGSCGTSQLFSTMTFNCDPQAFDCENLPTTCGANGLLDLDPDTTKFYLRGVEPADGKPLRVRVYHKPHPHSSPLRGSLACPRGPVLKPAPPHLSHPRSHPSRSVHPQILPTNDGLCRKGWLKP